MERTDILRIASACTKVKVDSGELIIRKDDPPGELYIVSEGSFKVFDDSLGEDFVYAILTRGDIFGEMSFLDNSSRSASVAALSDGSLLKMGSEEFGNLLREHPETASNFLFALSSVVTGRLREVNDALTNMTFGTESNEGEMTLEDVIAQMHIAVHIELSSSRDFEME